MCLSVCAFWMMLIYTVLSVLCKISMYQVCVCVCVLRDINMYYWHVIFVIQYWLVSCFLYIVWYYCVFWLMQSCMRVYLYMYIVHVIWLKYVSSSSSSSSISSSYLNCVSCVWRCAYYKMQNVCYILHIIKGVSLGFRDVYKTYGIVAK